MKWIQYFLGALFILFAVVQYNDPDPFLWIVIYGIVGIVCVLNGLGWFPKSTVMLFLIAMGLYTLLHLPYVVEWLTIENSGDLISGMSDDKPYIEGTREFFGLLMADITLAYLLFFKKKSSELRKSF
ncbi:MAG: transmembrane 220 family protein [Cyclobacteriaceae bacterium]